jgi:hypothetical protein
MTDERPAGDAPWRMLRRFRPVLSRTRPYLLLELILVAAAYEVYAHVRDLHGRSGGAGAFHLALGHGRDVEHLERTLHLDPEHWLQSLVIHHHGVLHGMAVFYLSAHVIVTASTLIFLYVRRPAIYRRARNVLLLVTFAAVGLFALFPTAPPRLVQGSGLRDTLAITGGLWSYNGGALEKIADPYAAMPSLHLGWSTWVAMSLALAFSHWSWRRRALFFAYPTVVTLNVLATGAHWFLDTVAGSALLLVIWFAYGWALRAWQARATVAATATVPATVSRPAVITVPDLVRPGRAHAEAALPAED